MSIVQHGFGDRVRKARDIRGLSQTDLIAEIRKLFDRRPLSLRTLKRIESGTYHRYRGRARLQLSRVLPELLGPA